MLIVLYYFKHVKIHPNGIFGEEHEPCFPSAPWSQAVWTLVRALQSQTKRLKLGWYQVLNHSRRKSGKNILYSPILAWNSNLLLFGTLFGAHICRSVFLKQILWLLRSPSSHALQNNCGPQIVTKEHVLRAWVFSVTAKMAENKAWVSSYSFFPILPNMQSPW